MRISKRTALLCGYGASIGLLILSAVQAFSIQDALSRQQSSVYRTYVDQEEALSALRRNISTASNRTRDFFLVSKTPDHAGLLRSQLSALEGESRQAFAKLRNAPGGISSLDGAERELNYFWATLTPVPDAMLSADAAAQNDFLRREVAPRRNSANDALNGLSEAARKDFLRAGRSILASRRDSGLRLLALLALSVLAAVAVAWYSVRHVERLEAAAEARYSEVSRARRQFEQLSARLLDVEEEGRKRLSRELQTEIGRALSMLELEVSGAQNREPSPELRERLVRAHTLIERAMESIRNVSLLLRPALLDDLGLVPAIEYQIHEFLRRSGIDCEFSAEAVDERLPEAVKTCVYRVVQEALNNCEKHAGASRVRVALKQEREFLSVVVEDNGRGFEIGPLEAPSHKSGLGLVGLRERAAHVGGQVLVASAPGCGARITLHIPIGAAVESRAGRQGAIA